MKFCRFLICNGYFEKEDAKLKAASENQIFIGKLLYIFQLGMNHNQHGIYSLLKMDMTESYSF